MPTLKGLEWGMKTRLLLGPGSCNTQTWRSFVGEVGVCGGGGEVLGGGGGAEDGLREARHT